MLSNSWYTRRRESTSPARPTAPPGLMFRELTGFARSLTLVGLVLPMACSHKATKEPTDKSPRLVLLYAGCTVNRQYLSPYNERVHYTPNLESFRQHAMTFAKHQTEAGVSGIAFASMFSGTQAMQHGVYSHPTTLPDSSRLLTEVYADEGYEVFAWLNHPMASARLNYAQGVEPDHVSKQMLRAGEPIFQEILDRLKGDPTYRAFVVTNFKSVTHRPYRPERLESFCQEYPTECRAREDVVDFAQYTELFRTNHISFAYDFDRTVESLQLSRRQVDKVANVVELLYKAGIFEIDALFGAVVQEIDSRALLPESIIVFTADHGEAFYREGSPFKWSHSTQGKYATSIGLAPAGRLRFTGPQIRGLCRRIFIFD